GKNIIARLSRTSLLNPAKGAQNVVDAGLAEVIDNRDVTCRFLGPIGRLQSAGFWPPRARMQVQKFGRTTRHRIGHIDSIYATFKVEFGDRVYEFVDQLVIHNDDEPFASGGDSGSLIVGCRSRGPIGLLMAGSPDGRAVANRFDNVQNSLGFTLLA